MTIKFVKKDNDEVSLTTFMGKADKDDPIMGDLVFMSLTIFFLIAYVAYFSVKKFRRVKQEKIVFEKMQKIGKKENLDLAQGVRANLFDKDFLKGEAVAANQFTMAPKNVPSPRPLLAMRKSQSFVEKRVLAFNDTMREVNEKKRLLLDEKLIKGE